MAGNKIGFVENLYYTPRGHSYVVHNMVSALLDAGHEAHMFRIHNNPPVDEFRKPTTERTWDGNVIPKKDFENWLDEIEPEFMVFNEYAQWWSEDHDKVAVCKARGIKTIGYLVWERLDWNKKNHYQQYDKIVCPTGHLTRHLRQNGLDNAVHVPWGVDFKEIDAIPQPPSRKDGKIVFYHCKGGGGAGDRKNTKAVIRAYNMIKDEKTDLIITHLDAKVFTKAEIYGFTKYADVLVNTARWETIGINNLEANACGRPVIVCDMPPVNELVKENINGFTVNGSFGKADVVSCPVCDVDVESLAQKMTLFKNEELSAIMKVNSRRFAEVNFDWEKNKVYFLQLFQ